jgi:hypothetical protein
VCVHNFFDTTATMSTSTNTTHTSDVSELPAALDLAPSASVIVLPAESTIISQTGQPAESPAVAASAPMASGSGLPDESAEPQPNPPACSWASSSSDEESEQPKQDGTVEKAKKHRRQRGSRGGKKKDKALAEASQQPNPNPSAAVPLAPKPAEVQRPSVSTTAAAQQPAQKQVAAKPAPSVEQQPAEKKKKQPAPSGAAKQSAPPAAAQQSAPSVVTTPPAKPAAAQQPVSKPVAAQQPSKSQKGQAGSSELASKAGSSNGEQSQQGSKGRGRGNANAAAQAAAPAEPKPIDSSAKKTFSQAVKPSKSQAAEGASVSSQPPSKGPAGGRHFQGRQGGAASVADTGVSRGCSSAGVREINPANHEIAAELLHAAITCPTVFVENEDGILDRCKADVRKPWGACTAGYRTFFNALMPGDDRDVFIVKMAQIFGSEAGLSVQAANVYLRENLLPAVNSWGGEDFGETFCINYDSALRYMFNCMKGKCPDVSFGENIITSFGYALVNTAFNRGSSSGLGMAPHLFDILRATHVTLPVRIVGEGFDAVNLVNNPSDCGVPLLFSVERKGQMERIKMEIYNRIANQVCTTLCRPAGRLNYKFHRLTHAFELNADGIPTCETKLFDGGKAIVCTKINESIGFTRGRDDVRRSACRLVDNLAYVGPNETQQEAGASSSTPNPVNRIVVALGETVLDDPEAIEKLMSYVRSSTIGLRVAESERDKAIARAQVEESVRAEAEKERKEALEREKAAVIDAANARSFAHGSQMGQHAAYRELSLMQTAVAGMGDRIAIQDAHIARLEAMLGMAHSAVCDREDYIAQLEQIAHQRRR